MNAVPESAPPGGPRRHLATRSTAELVSLVVSKAVELARKEVVLAQVELRDDIRTELHAARALGFAGLGAVCAVNMLLVAVILALSQVMLPWVAALVVAVAVALVAGVVALVARRRLVRTPLEDTRQMLRENAEWMHRSLH
ncbi:MAG: phage holin family protein [Myxococcota bacterium]